MLTFEKYPQLGHRDISPLNIQTSSTQSLGVIAYQNIERGSKEIL
jgi:hypothetical protein